MSRPIKKVMVILLSLVMAISLLPILKLPTWALSVSGTLSFTGSKVLNSQTSKIYDGGNFNGIVCSDIPNIQLDIFGANSVIEALNGIATGGILYTPKDGLGITDGGILTVADTVQNGLGDEASIPKILVIKSNDGKEFSLQSIYVGDYLCGNSPIRFTGYRNGATTGSCDLVINTSDYEDTFILNKSLPQSVFENVDMVLITNQYDGDMIWCNYALFNHINIGDPVVPNTVPTFVGGAMGTLTAHAGQTDVKPLLHVNDSDSGQTLTWSQFSGPTHGTLEMNSGTPQASSGGTDIAPGGTIFYTPESGYTGTDSFIIKVSDGITIATKAITVNVDSDEVMTFVGSEFTVNDNHPPVSKLYKGVLFYMTPVENNYTTIYDHPPFSGVYALDKDSIDGYGTKFTISAPGHSFDLNSFMYYADEQNPTLTITATTVGGSPITLTYPTNISTSLQEGTYSFNSLAGQFDDLVSVTFSSSIYTTFNNFHITDIRSLSEIDIQGNGLSIASGDTTPSNSDGTDFGGTGVSGGSVERTFTILNTGTEELALSGSPLVSISGASASDFSVTAVPTSPIAAGGSTNFTITFGPTAVGTRTAIVTIANNDGNEGSYTFTIQGTGLSSNAALSGGTVKGQTAILGMPDSNLSWVTEGSVALTGLEGADTSGTGVFITSFSKADASSTVKVVKYPTGTTDFSNFNLASAYAHEAVTNGDIFVVRVTAEDGTVNYYKIVATIAQAPVLSTNTGLTADEGAEATVMNSMLMITDLDTDSTSITYTVGTVPAHGTLKKSGTALSASGTFTQDDVDNSRVSYTHDGSETISDSFSFTVSDGTYRLSEELFTITINPINDPPIITAPESISVIEDNYTTLMGISFSDADAGYAAITATFSVPSGMLSAMSGGGVNVGGTALALTLTGSITNINSYIANKSISYITASDANGSIDLTLSINDNGQKGGGGAKTATTTTQLNITPINDAPTLSAGPYTLVDTNEDTISSSTIVSGILTGLSGQDVDGNSLGIALTGTTGNGRWEYSTDGYTWTGVGTVSLNAALLLSPYTQLRYVPDGQNGETATLTFHAWDGTSGSPSTNGTRIFADASTNGGTTAFSIVTAQATLTVSSVNDAPVLSPTAPSLPSLTTGQTENVGQTVSSFVSGMISDFDPGALEGIAIVATTDGSGKWQFSTDNGGSWADVGEVSQSNALLLRDVDKVRFVPGSPDATTASITYHAWDRTSSSQGNKFDVTTYGGTTAFSVATDTASITVDSEASVVEVSSTNANRVYKAGDTIVVTVKFSKAVTVAGTPQLTLKLGAKNRIANYFSGSGTDTLCFIYTVEPGDSGSPLDYSSDNALSVIGGAIQTGGADVSLILPMPGSAGSLGDNKNIVIDGVAPSVASVLVPGDGLYRVGENLDFTVSFSEPVSISGAGAVLVINVGGTSRQATYLSKTVDSVSFRYTIQPGEADADGILLNEINLNGDTIQDTAGNNALLTLPVIDTSKILVDGVAPMVSGIVRQTPASELTNASSLIFRVAFNEPVKNVSTDDFALVATGTVGGNITSVSSSSGTEIDVSISGVSGDGTLRLDLKSGTDISDTAGNLITGGYTGDEGYSVDKTAPIIGGSGLITTGDLSSSSVKLTWMAASDSFTAVGSLRYKVVYSTSSSISTVADALSNGSVAKDWTTDLTTLTVTGLSPKTDYYFNVLVTDAVGNVSAYTVATARTSEIPTSSLPSAETNSNTGTEILVNGQKQTAGTTQTTTNASGQTVTTVTVDTDRLENILASQGSGATVVIPITTGSDVAAGTLTGAMVKSMEEKAATLVVQTNVGSYTLPAAQINIDALSQQFGEDVSLSDIRVTISVSEPSNSMVQIVESASQDGGFTIMVPAVDYTITCTHGNQTVSISSFNAYVERTIAIPSGVDPTKITTGVVFKPDGTVYHVPTRVVNIDGKYYAVINSLTNSTYAIICNPVEFVDVAGHWAKGSINNMGSRMVVTGTGNNQYAPGKSMTRAEFAAIIVRALGLEPGVGASGFSDVADSAWYSGYVKTAADYGVIEGYGNGVFGPNDTITREQAMTMLARAMDITGLEAGLTDQEVGKLLEAYSDGSAISSYARYSVAVCLKTGITSGTSAKTLSPGDKITRAEIAVMVERLLQKSNLI